MTRRGLADVDQAEGEGRRRQARPPEAFASHRGREDAQRGSAAGSAARVSASAMIDDTRAGPVRRDGRPGRCELRPTSGRGTSRGPGAPSTPRTRIVRSWGSAMRRSWSARLLTFSSVSRGGGFGAGTSCRRRCRWAGPRSAPPVPSRYCARVPCEADASFSRVERNRLNFGSVVPGEGSATRPARIAALPDSDPGEDEGTAPMEISKFTTRTQEAIAAAIQAATGAGHTPARGRAPARRAARPARHPGPVRCSRPRASTPDAVAAATAAEIGRLPAATGTTVSAPSYSRAAIQALTDLAGHRRGDEGRVHLRRAPAHRARDRRLAARSGSLVEHGASAEALRGALPQVRTHADHHARTRRRRSRRSRSTPSTSPPAPTRARSTRSSAATTRSAASCRCCRGAPRTTPC